MAAKVTIATVIKLVGAFNRWFSGRGKEEKCKRYADSINKALDLAETLSEIPDDWAIDISSADLGYRKQGHEPSTKTFEAFVDLMVYLLQPVGFAHSNVIKSLYDGVKSGGTKKAGFDKAGRYRGNRALYLFDGSIGSALEVVETGTLEILDVIKHDCEADEAVITSVAAGFSLFNELMKDSPDWAAVARYVGIMTGQNPAEMRRIFAEIKRSRPDANLTDPEDITNTFAGVDEAVGSIKTYIKDLLDSVHEWLTGVIDDITTTISTLVDEVVTSMGLLIDDIVSSIAESMDSAIAYIETMAAEIALSINAFIEDAVDTIQSSFTSAVDYVSELIGQVAQWIDDITVLLQQEIEDIFHGIEETIATIEESIGRLVDEVVTGAQGALSVVTETVESIPASLREIAQPIIEILQAQPERAKAVFDYIVKDVALPDVFKSEAESKEIFTKRLANVFDIMGVDSKTADDMARQIHAVAPDGPITGFVFFFTLLASLIFQGVSVPIGIAMERSRQAYNLALPSKLMAEADQLTAAVRGLKDKGVVIREIRAMGYNEADAEALYQMRRQLMPAGEVMVWWLRGLLSDTELTDYLTASGVSTTDIDKLKQAAFFIPPPQDLITMAVRDVFAPETAEKFGQFEDFPQAFADHAAKQGVSEEWARNYWAAHWGLPSPNQGFEMFQRGIIDKGTLEMLLKALDIMPFWREKMIQLSYNVLTRVDVRRMHDIGVLDLAGVRKAYQDMGYSPDDAEALTQFTERLNSPKTADDDTELGQVSRAAIIKFYTEGVIERERAATLLKGIGASDDGANLYLDLADMEIELQERKAEIDLVIEQEAAGIINFEEAVGRIGEMGFSTIEQQKAVARLTKRQRQSNKLPSRSELDKMISGGIIDDAVYRETMERNGYSRVWTERYLRLVKMETTADENG